MTSAKFLGPLRGPLVLTVFSLGLLASPLAAAGLDGPQRIELEPAVAVEQYPSPDDLIQLGNRLYFTAYDRQHGRELWTTDGSGGDARRVADLCPGLCDSRPEHFELLGDRLLFTADDGGGPVLFSLREGQVEVVVRPPGQVGDTEIFGGRLYVAVYSPYSKYRLFTTSGVPGNWQLFENLCTDPTPPYCFAPELFVHGGSLYYLRQGALRKAAANGQATSLRALVRADDFEALSATTFLFRACGEDLPGTCRLFSSDGTVAGTLPVNPNPSDETTEDPSDLRRWNGLVYFENGYGILHTDGTSLGTQVASELQQVPGLRSGILATTATKLFYTAFVEGNQRVIRAYSTDGSDYLMLGPAALSLKTIGQAGDRVLFENNGRFIWSDGTAAGTLLLDGWRTTNYRRVSAELGGNLYVSAARSGYSSQLWRFDSAGNATLVAGASPSAQGDQAIPSALGPNALLAATSGDHRNLYRVDPASLLAGVVENGLTFEPGEVSGSTMMARHPVPGFGSPETFAVTPDSATATGLSGYQSFAGDGDGRFYYRAAGIGQRVMETDGTADGTRELLDLYPGFNVPSGCYHCPPVLPSSITVSGDNVYFTGAAAPGAGNGELALWVYHRASGDREALKAIDDYEPELIPFGNGKVAFYSDSYLDGERGLWTSDGTVPGTRRAFELSDAERYDSVYFLENVGERLFFQSDNIFQRLWSSDLEPGGTYVLLDPDRLRLGESAAVGDQLFFVASTLENGSELWVTDGTAAGTREIDIRPGPASSLPTSLYRVGARLAFAADDGIHGHELFLSDGTAEGTFLLADLAPGAPASSPAHLAAVGERLFFQANDGGASGRGLWALDLPAAASSPCPADRLCLLGDRFEVEVKASVGSVVFAGQRARASAESGVFSFFGPDNWEMMVKVLDGCALNQNFWVYAAAATDLPFELKVKDRASGEQRVYASQGGRATPILDSGAFATCDSAPVAPLHSPVLPLGEPAPRCPETRNAFCFGDGRFVAKVDWQTADGAGSGHTEPYGSRDSGLFTFFSPSNWELMVKVLDGCAINGRHWVYLAGTTDVGWLLTIVDQVTGVRRHYENPLGQAAPAITDTQAFAGCP